MTKAQAADLKTKWEQHGDPPPLCKHPIQELARLARSDKSYLGYLIGTYHCRECGKAILHTHEPPAFTPLID